MKGNAEINSVGGPAYVTPCCLVMEITSEGVLCQSGLHQGGFHEPVEGDDTPII